jgi:glucose-6-phosphate-specific signal transduction histidine kinase
MSSVFIGAAASAEVRLFGELPLRRARKPRMPTREIGRLRQHVATQIEGMIARDFEAILGQFHLGIPASIEKSAGLKHIRLAIAAAEQGLMLARGLAEQLRLPERELQKTEPKVMIGPALKDELSGVLSRASIAHSFCCDTNISLPSAVTHEILQIAREVAINALKHSAARSIVCSLRAHNDALILRIQDNGRGFDPSTPATGFGLVGLTERARSIGADIKIDTGVGKGTVVTLHCRVSSHVKILSRKTSNFGGEERCQAISQSQS